MEGQELHFVITGDANGLRSTFNDAKNHVHQSMKQIENDSTSGTEVLKKKAEEVRNAFLESIREVVRLRNEYKSLSEGGASLDVLINKAEELAAAQRKAADDGKTAQSVQTEYVKALQTEYGKTSVEARTAAIENMNLLRAVEQVDSEAERTQSVVEKYKEKIKELGQDAGNTSEKIKGASKSTGSLVDDIKKVPGPIGNVTSSVNGLTKASLRFIATPVGATLAAISAALAMVTSWFKRTEEGQNALAVGSAYFTQILNSVLDVADNVGEWLFKAFTKPKEALSDLVEFMKGQVINRINAVGEMAQGIWKILKGQFSEGFKQLSDGYLQGITGVQNVTGKVSSWMSDTNKKAEERVSIARRQNELDKKERENLVEKAKKEKEIAELREKAYDKSIPEKERAKYIAEAQKKTKEMYDTELSLARERYEIIRDTNKLSHSNKEDKKKEAEAEAELYRIEGQRATALKGLMREQNRIDSAGASAANKSAELRQKQFEVEQKELEEQARQRIATRKAQADAEIAQIEDDAQRRRAEEDAQFKQDMEAIDAQVEEFKRKNLELAEARFNATNTDKSKKFSDTALGRDVAVNGLKNIKLTDDQEAQLAANRKQREAEYKRVLEQRWKDEAQALRDYLTEFGTVQQQRLAIQQDYDAKIAATADATQKKTLEAQKQKALDAFDIELLRTEIDWTTMFDGLGNALEDEMKETLDKVEKYIQSEAFSRKDAREKAEYVNLRNNLTQKVGGGSFAFGQIGKDMEAYQKALRDAKVAESMHAMAVMELDVANKELKEAEERVKVARTEEEKRIAEENLKKAKEKQKLAQGAVNTTRQTQRETQGNVVVAQGNVTKSLTKTKEAIDVFGASLSGITSGTLKGFADGVVRLVGLISGSDSLQKGLEGLGNNIGGLISAILSIIDALGDDPAGFIDDILNKVATVIEAVISQLPQIIMSILKGAVNIVGSVWTGLGGLFGLGSSNNHEEMVKRQERYNIALDSASKAIDHFTEELEKSYGVMAIQNAKQGEELIKKSMETIIKGIDSVMWDNYGGGNSDYYHANKALNWQGGDLQNAGILDFFKRYGVNAWEDSQGKYTWNALFNNNDPEKLAKMFKDMEILDPNLWRIITSEMGANSGALKDWLEKLIDAYDQIEENDKQLKEQLTTTTADNVYSDFLNSLYDLADGSEDVTENIAEDWQKMVNRMVVNNLIAEKMRESLTKWYEELAKLQEQRSNGEIGDVAYREGLNNLQAAYNEIVERGKSEIEQFTKDGIIKPISETADETKKYFEDLLDSWKSTLSDMSATTEDWKNKLIDQALGDLIESTILDAPIDVVIGDWVTHFDNFEKYLENWSERYKKVIEGSYENEADRIADINALIQEQTDVRDELADKSKEIAAGLGKDISEAFSNSLDNLGDTLLNNLLDSEKDAGQIGAEIGKTLVQEMLKEILASEKYAQPMAQIKALWQNVLKGGGSWTDTEGVFGEAGIVYTLDKVLEKITALNSEIAGDEDVQKATQAWQDYDNALKKATSSFGDLHDLFMDAILDMENGTENLGKKLRETVIKDLIEKKAFEGFDEFKEDWVNRYLDALEKGDEKLIDKLIKELKAREKAMAESVEGYVKSLQEAVEDTTFTGMESNFVSALMDIDGDIEDFANDMKKTIVQKLVEAFMVSEKIKPLLDDLQNTFNYAMGLEGLSESQRASIIASGYTDANGEFHKGIDNIAEPLTTLQGTVKAMLEAIGYKAKETAGLFDDLGERIANSLGGGKDNFISGLTESIVDEMTNAYMATEEFQEKLADVKKELLAASEAVKNAKTDEEIAAAAEQMKKAEEHAGGLYDEVENATEAIRNLNQELEHDTTFKDMTSSWVSNLMDFNATAEDWAEDIGRTMAQRIIEQMVMPTLMQPLLDSLQEAFDAAIEAKGGDSTKWDEVIGAKGVLDALQKIADAYPNLKQTVTDILAALNITPETEKAKDAFNDLTGTIISGLTNAEMTAEEFAKSIARTLTTQMMSEMLKAQFSSQMADIQQMWADALVGRDVSKIEAVKTKIVELYNAMGLSSKELLGVFKELEEEVADTTFSGIADSWTSMLLDMEATAEDWAKSVGQTIAQEIIKKMVVPTIIQPVLDLMQDAWDEAAKQESATYLTMLDAVLPYLGDLTAAYDELRPIADYILNSLGVYKETVEEIAEEVEYALQDMKSNFVSSLMDMQGDAESWSQSISKTLAEAFIKDFVLGDAFDAQMKNWQEHYESIIHSGLSEAERAKQLKLLRDAIKSAKEGYVEQALAIQELLGLNTIASSEQKATMNMADKITYEQADQLLGVNMAQEMTLEQILDVIRKTPSSYKTGVSDGSRQIEATLQDLSALNLPDGDTVREMRGLIIIGNSYLFDIRESNAQILRQFGDRLESIDNRLAGII